MYDRIETHVRSLDALGLPVSGYQQLLAPIIVNKVPSELRIAITREVKDSDLSKILGCIKEEVMVREKCLLSKVAVGQSQKQNPIEESRPRWAGRNNIATTSTLHTHHGLDSEQQKEVKCAYCDGTHKSHLCKTVTDHQVRKKILSTKNRCFICLCPGHVARNCRTNMRCLKCNRRHHSTICDCYSKETVHGKSETNEMRENRGTSLETTSQSTTNMHVNAKNSVLLQTARVQVKPPQKQQSSTVRLVFDSGSQKSYITKEVKDALDLPVVGKDKLLIKTFGDTSPKITTCEIVQVGLLCKDGAEFIMHAYVVPVICTPISNQVLSAAIDKYEHLRGLDLADYCEGDALDIDKTVGILVGADYYWSLVGNRVIRGDRRGPVAMETKVGWVVSGPTEMVSENSYSHLLKIDANVIEREDGLLNEIKNFWNNESIGIKNNMIEQGVLEKFEEDVRFVDNRYEIKLPFKEGHSPVPDNYSLTRKRLTTQLSRLKEDEEIAQKYDKVIREQLSEGIIERVNESESIAPKVGMITYLPHHQVLRPERETTKLRVVFDASAKWKGEGLSLNDVLDPGPSLLPLLYDILLRFRVGKVVLIGDIEKAFLNISIAPEHRDFLRFLWVDDVNPDNPEVITYRFRRLCFGLVSSPFILNATVRHHMSKYVKEDANFVETVMNSLYCDDFVGSFNNEHETYLLYKKLRARFSQGAFNMRKWTSNSKDLLNKINENEGIKQKENRPESKVLGLLWNAETDQLKFDFPAMIGNIDEVITKRVVLATTAKLFDPLGLLSPVIVPLKLVFQELAKEKSDWDFPCSNPILRRWSDIINDMLQTGNICFDRFYLDRQFDADEIDLIELHGFCDASLNAYGGCVYIVYQLKAGSRVACLVSSKTRIAPIGGETVPRLELLAALILARLMDSVKHAVNKKLQIRSYFYWSDSQITLWWISNVNKTLKPFVQNRVVEIRELSAPPQWSYCPSKQNPADILSRGARASTLKGNSLWWKGPEFICKPPECWPTIDNNENTDTFDFDTDCEPISVNLAIAHKVCLNELIPVERFSELNKLFRVTAYVLRFVNNIRARIAKTEPIIEEINYQELENARLRWLLCVQNKVTEDENFRNLKSNLNLFQDEDKLLRCKGRIDNAPLPFETRFPVILPREGHFTDLILAQCHKDVRHNGVNETLTELRSRYWIVRGRQRVKRFLSKCVRCKRIQGRNYNIPPEPPLPDFRTDIGHAFSKIGINYAGPIFVKNIFGHETTMFKSYIALITCASTRAVHLELTPDMGAEALIRASKRFQARRGIPRFIISDNGKTFKDLTVKSYVIENGTQWNFITERAPWFGGFYERLVQSVKRCLRKTLRNAKLNYEELNTHLIEVEGVLNSRPLTYLYDEIGEPLTPSHLIMCRRILDRPNQREICDIVSNAKSLKGRAKYLSIILEHFRTRFKREYLTALREFHTLKKTLNNRVICKGHIVTVYEDKRPRQMWRLGRIVDLIRGNDQNVRSAIVRVYSNGRIIDIRRPVKLLYPVELSEEFEEQNNDASEPKITSVMDENVIDFIS